MPRGARLKAEDAAEFDSNLFNEKSRCHKVFTPLAAGLGAYWLESPYAI